MIDVSHLVQPGFNGFVHKLLDGEQGAETNIFCLTVISTHANPFAKLGKSIRWLILVR